MLEWMALTSTGNRILSTLTWGGGGTFVTCCVHGDLKLSLVDGGTVLWSLCFYVRSVLIDLDQEKLLYIELTWGEEGGGSPYRFALAAV